MGSSLFEQNLSGSAFRRGLPLPREIRLTGIILSSSLSLFLSRWVKNRPVNCHNALSSGEDNEEASLLGYPPIGPLDQKSLREWNQEIGRGGPYIPGLKTPRLYGPHGKRLSRERK